MYLTKKTKKKNISLFNRSLGMQSRKDYHTKNNEAISIQRLTLPYLVVWRCEEIYKKKRHLENKNTKSNTLLFRGFGMERAY